MSLLKVENIHVFYDNVEVLRNVSLAVEEKMIVTLIGANGAGKTTTLRAISGLVRLRSGSISYNDANISELPAHEVPRLGIVQVPEGRRLFGRLTVAENLELGAFVRNDRHALGRERDRLLTLFPRLRERLRQTAGTLSGGEQQMVAVARAMMAKPRVLLMDEPSMGLSPMMVEQIFESICAINAQGVAILLVEQNAVMALSIAKYGYVMESGRIVQSGPGEELLDSESVRRAYLG